HRSPDAALRRPHVLALRRRFVTGRDGASGRSGVAGDRWSPLRFSAAPATWRAGTGACVDGDGQGEPQRAIRRRHDQDRHIRLALSAVAWRVLSAGAGPATRARVRVALLPQHRTERLVLLVAATG